jgi:hypothetical protein
MSTSFWRNFLQSKGGLRIDDTFLEFFGHGGTEHHYLFGMGSLDEDLLDVRSHFRVAEDLVTFINDEELALSLLRRRSTLSKLISLCFPKSTSLPGVAMIM